MIIPLFYRLQAIFFIAKYQLNHISFFNMVKNNNIGRSKRYLEYYDELIPIYDEPVAVVHVVDDNDIIRRFVANIAYNIGYLIGR
uniref:Glycosyltransferase n=1 Tax=Strongyloides papillosus TaxID=174720 RepID=A0A0N5BX09_STREA